MQSKFCLLHVEQIFNNSNLRVIKQIVDLIDLDCFKITFQIFFFQHEKSSGNEWK